MGKKKPASAPMVPQPSKKKAATCLPTAAEDPPAAAGADLLHATELLENLPTDVLLAFVKSRGANVKENASDDDWDAKPRPRERLSTLRTDVQNRDSQVMKSHSDQIEQLVDGTITIAEALMQAIDPKTSVEKLTVAGLTLMFNRLKHYSVALKRAGPKAGGSLDAAYEIWQEKRLQFATEEFKPDELEKTEVEAAMARHKSQLSRGFWGSDRGKGGQRREFRGNSFSHRPRFSPKQSRRDRSRSRSPDKKK